MSELPSNLTNQIELLNNKADEELLEIIGAFALSQQPNTLRSSLASDGAIDVLRIRNAGQQFLKEIEPYVKEAICGPDGLASYVENVTAQDILIVLLPILGMSQGGMVPTAIIAVCIVILRVGLRKFCKEAGT